MNTELMAEIESTFEDVNDGEPDNASDGSDVENVVDKKDSATKKEDGEQPQKEADSDDSEKKPEEGEDDGEKLSRKERRAKRYSDMKSQVDRLATDNFTLQKKLKELESAKKDAGTELKEPDVKDFENQRDYDVAMGRYMAKKEQIDSEKERQEEESFKSDIAKCNEAIEKDAARFPGFYESIKSLSNLPHTPALHDVLLNTPNPAAVMMHLAEFPSVAANIFKQSDVAQSRYLTQISLKLQERDKRKVVSNAKPPVTKLNSKPSAKVNEDEMNAEEYYEHVYKKKK
jgi:hypothetical protein